MSNPLIEIVKRLRGQQADAKQRAVIDIPANTGDGYNALYLEYTIAQNITVAIDWLRNTNLSPAVGSTYTWQHRGADETDRIIERMAGFEFVLADRATRWTTYQRWEFVTYQGTTKVDRSGETPSYRYQTFTAKLLETTGNFATSDQIFFKIPDLTGRPLGVTGYTMLTPDTFAATAQVDGHKLTVSGTDRSILQPGFYNWLVEQADDGSGTNAVTYMYGPGDLPALLTVAPGTAKYYRIRSVSILGDLSAWSSYTSANFNTTPAAPVWASHTYTTTGHLVTWSHPSPLSVDYYTLYRNTVASTTGAITVTSVDSNAVSYVIPYDTIGGYFGIKAVGYSGTGSAVVWTAQPYLEHEPTVKDNFDGYGWLTTSPLNSLYWLKIADFDTIDGWVNQSGSAITLSSTYKIEGNYSCYVQQSFQILKYLTSAIDFTAEQRFTDDDYMIMSVYMVSAPTADRYITLRIRGGTSHSSYTDQYRYRWSTNDMAAGWNYLKAKRSDFTIEAGAASGWASILQYDITNGYLTTSSGTDIYIDDLRIVKADPDDATTYNDTGGVWNFATTSGSTHWHIYPGNRSGEPVKPFTLGNINEESKWQIATVNGANIYTGTVQCGMYRKTSGYTALHFYWDESTLSGYSIDFDGTTLRILRWANGTGTQITTASFTASNNVQFWIGVDLREFQSDPGRIKVYASLTEGNLIQAANLKISYKDTSPRTPGGTVGVSTYSSNARFFGFVAGSPAHAEVADVARALDGPIIDGQDGDKRVFLSIDDGLKFSADKTNWSADFGATGIKADVIAESTSAAGVTVDGAKIKDADFYINTGTSAGNGLIHRLYHAGLTLDDDEHFRSGNAPAGHSWISDATFSGTPSSGEWSVFNDYCRWAANGAGLAHFYAKSTSVPGAAAPLRGRFTTGNVTQFGLRLDDGTNSKFAEIYVTGAASNKTITVEFRTNAATTTNSIVVPIGTFFYLNLSYIFSSNIFAGYISDEINFNQVYNVGAGAALGTISTIRSGILVRNVNEYGYCDWYQSGF